jgi:hypothetical protein
MNEAARASDPIVNPRGAKLEGVDVAQGWLFIWAFVRMRRKNARG